MLAQKAISFFNAFFCFQYLDTRCAIMLCYSKLSIIYFKPHFVADCLVVSSDLAVDFASTVIPRSQILDAPFISGVQRQFSRYFNEFEELQLLGKGAFGAVIKVLGVLAFTGRQAGSLGTSRST